jgi:hypothetical protein
MLAATIVLSGSPHMGMDQKGVLIFTPKKLM